MRSFTSLKVQLPAPGRWLGRLLLLLAFVGGAVQASRAQSITSFSPTSGGQGTLVTLNVTGFSGNVTVYFGYLSAPKYGITLGQVRANGTLTVQVPPSATSGPITVDDGSTAATSSTSFTVNPSITSFSPSSGVVGARVSIFTSNLPGNTTVFVYFGSQPSASSGTAAYVSSSGEINMTVPTSAVTGPITLSTKSGTGGTTATSSSSFTVNPSVTSFSPTSGVPGTSVTLNVTSFSGVVVVSFGSSTYQASGSVTNGTVTVSVPPGTVTGALTVRSIDGGPSATSSSPFTVPKSITSFSPTSGGPGTFVTLNVTGFSGRVTVYFSLSAPKYGITSGQVQSNGTLTVLVPPSAASGPITVDDGSTAATSSTSFTVPPTISYFSPTSGVVGARVSIFTSNLPSNTTVFVYFGSQPGASSGTAAKVDSYGAIDMVVPTSAVTGPITLSTTSGTGGTTATSSSSFTVLVPPQALTISTGTVAAPTAIAAGTYASLTVTGTGVAQLAGNVIVNGPIVVQDGGRLNDGCAIINGAGSFTLADGGTLGICSPDGISSSGASGAVQVTGTRSFSPDANYVYNGTAAQATGTGLPGTVRGLVLDNAQGATLGADLATSTSLTLTAGTLTTAAYKVVLGSAATLSESSTGYVVGTVETTRPVSTAGSAQDFGGLGLRLTPSGSTLPGSTLVRRVTGTALRGAGSSQGVNRSFDIQPTVRTGLDVDLALTVREDERNGIAPASLRLFKSDDGGSTWYLQNKATLATTAASGTQPTTYTASLGGVSNFSIWTLGDASNPLPVTLTTFTATAEGTGARLAWATATETNNDRFEVESSADGVAFQRVGTVAGHGTTLLPHQYNYLDADLTRYSAAVLYYRLRQVDRDGTASYSPVRTVAVPQLASLALFPSPTHSAATLTGAQPGAAVQVFDAVGRLVVDTRADGTGRAALLLPADVATGVYVVRTGTKALRLTVE